jgi:hypothetical protein
MFAQTQPFSENAAKTEFSEAIEDNSFYLEEAFNQEPGVVQHISTLTYFASPQKDVGYSFTQEWPVGSQVHQLSVTVPYSFLNGNTMSGINDILINYRYQLFNATDWAAVAPRISIILPTGDQDKGMGNGVVGIQTNIAASKRLTDLVIAHANAGMTILPRVEALTNAGQAIRRTLTSFNLGGSIILLASPNFNILTEGGVNFLSEVENGEVVHSTEIFVNPAIRFAIDIGDLQVVPGVGMPIFFANGTTRSGVFGYLSFEHPF